MSKNISSPNSYFFDYIGSHFGIQNHAQIDQERELKSNAKRAASRKAKEAQTSSDQRLGRWKGREAGRGKGKS